MATSVKQRKTSITTKEAKNYLQHIYWSLETKKKTLPNVTVTPTIISHNIHFQFPRNILTKILNDLSPNFLTLARDTLVSLVANPPSTVIALYLNKEKGIMYTIIMAMRRDTIRSGMRLSLLSETHIGTPIGLERLLT